MTVAQLKSYHHYDYKKPGGKDCCKNCDYCIEITELYSPYKKLKCSLFQFIVKPYKGCDNFKPDQAQPELAL